jgi:arsenate reductase
MPTDSLTKVLFLCTGNSARSILAEALLNRLGEGRVRAFSAGSQPRGEVHPEALALLQRHGFSLQGLRSKSWDVFAGTGTPAVDLVVTVCDDAARAAGEVCPIWPGGPLSAHWGIPDPAAVDGPECAAAFETAYRRLAARIAALVALPLDDLEPAALKQELDEIGALPDDAI